MFIVDNSPGANDVVIGPYALPIWLQPSLAMMDGNMAYILGDCLTARLRYLITTTRGQRTFEFQVW